MKEQPNRREVLAGAAATCALALLPKTQAGASQPFRAAGREVEIQISPVSDYTFRLTIFPIDNQAKESQLATVPDDGSLVQSSWGAPLASLRTRARVPSVKIGSFNVHATADPATITITSADGNTLQQLKVDEITGVLSFQIGNAPLLGLGEGGEQFDRRGTVDRMRSGQGGYKLETHGGRVPIPWLIGTSGWAMFLHYPYGAIDLTGQEGKFLPANPDSALPLDLFLVFASEPATIMAEYARITGHAEMPPLWSFGYQQSHRTLASREEIIAEAETFREKKLPCDALIYLGTGFCPSGWNTANGSFEWNSTAFPDPKQIIDDLHQEHFHVVLHSVIETDRLRGTVRDICEKGPANMEQASCLWDAHRKDFVMGVDGWWPDEGDPLDVASRLVRNRMYWEGAQVDRPNERPYALHRNGYAGMQRYGSFLWSGDVYSKWETLQVHIPIAINTALTGIPLWGTDIGGFVPTKEFTAELYLRWFQFAAFCPLFRAHGRTWKLRLPWGWNTGDPGPVEIRNYGGAAIPDASQLHNPQVEPICRKYLELRYRLLPYLYSAMHECATTGMPIVRALWLHYPDDPKAVTCGDEYLWGRSMLVAPVVEQGSTSRKVYLPRGEWYDFWTGERMRGGAEIQRAIDLETMPLYVHAGTILPLGPVKQYVAEKVDQPLSVSIYPGADSSFLLYEDDGNSFNYRQGEWMGLQMEWQDHRRMLRLALANGSRMLGPGAMPIEVRLEQSRREIIFEGKALEVSFR
jgi:alpha-glucosidase/alpha-D-xyloside xylohydrolase